MLQQIFFYLLALVVVVAGLMVISLKNPISSAISLVVTLAGVAGLFVLLDGHFVATVQVLVYAGAIMVLFVFVIMLLNLHPEDLGERKVTAVGVIGAGAGLLSGALLAWRLSSVSGSFPVVPKDYGSLSQVAMTLFTRYLVPFEAVSVLLTAAVVGAVIIAKRDLSE